QIRNAYADGVGARGGIGMGAADVEAEHRVDSSRAGGGGAVAPVDDGAEVAGAGIQVGIGEGGDHAGEHGSRVEVKGPVPGGGQRAVGHGGAGAGAGAAADDIHDGDGDGVGPGHGVGVTAVDDKAAGEAGGDRAARGVGVAPVHLHAEVARAGERVGV